MNNKEMRFVLKRENLEYLFGMLKNVAIKDKVCESFKNQIFKNSLPTNLFTLVLNVDETENLLDELSDDFIARGIDKNSEPNKLGIEIEGLIDVFSNIFYDD